MISVRPRNVRTNLGTLLKVLAGTPSRWGSPLGKEAGHGGVRTGAYSAGGRKPSAKCRGLPARQWEPSAKWRGSVRVRENLRQSGVVCPDRASKGGDPPCAGHSGYILLFEFDNTGARNQVCAAAGQIGTDRSSWSCPRWQQGLWRAPAATATGAMAHTHPRRRQMRRGDIPTDVNRTNWCARSGERRSRGAAAASAEARTEPGQARARPHAARVEALSFPHLVMGADEIAIALHLEEVELHRTGEERPS